MWRRLNLVLAAFWALFGVVHIVLTVIAYTTGWIYSVAFVSVLSLEALVVAGFGASLSAVAAWRADVPTEGA